MTASNTAGSLPRDPVDAIVVGSGAAGSNMAARLAEGLSKIPGVSLAHPAEVKVSLGRTRIRRA